MLKRKRQKDKLKLRLIVRLVLKMVAMGLDKALGLAIDQHCLSCPHLEKRLTTLTHTYSALKLMPLLLNGIKLIGSHICLLC